MNLITSKSKDKSELNLTAEEMQLVREFRVLSDKKKEIFADAIHGCAIATFAQKPALRLVAGGAA
jgi:hypothetical protein